MKVRSLSVNSLLEVAHSRKLTLHSKEPQVIQKKKLCRLSTFCELASMMETNTYLGQPTAGINLAAMRPSSFRKKTLTHLSGIQTGSKYQAIVLMQIQIIIKSLM
jgi:hypothetical protein